MRDVVEIATERTAHACLRAPGRRAVLSGSSNLREHRAINTMFLLAGMRMVTRSQGVCESDVVAVIEANRMAKILLIEVDSETAEARRH